MAGELHNRFLYLDHRVMHEAPEATNRFLYLDHRVMHDAPEATNTFLYLDHYVSANVVNSPFRLVPGGTSL